MKQFGQRVRRIVDKEWVRKGWVGMPTLRHHLIALVPMLALFASSIMVDQWSYDLGTVIMVTGIVVYGVLIMWIHLRRMAALGYFSTRRSERIAERHRRQRARLAAAASDD